MANYNESNVTGSEYQRARLVQVSNEYNGGKSITFVEEVVTTLSNGKVVHTAAGQVSEPFGPENMLSEFPILNPETGEQIGQSAKYVDVYVLLHSLYLHLAARRDAAIEPEQGE
jgi:hypothetical protein